MERWIDPALVPRRRLNNGMELPAIGIGTFGSDRNGPDEVAAAVDGALRGGYRLFDCASVYGNEAQIGRIFRRAFADGVVRRDQMTVMSKVWNDKHGPGDVLLSCAQTLKDLGLNELDVYFVHWPFPNYHAPGCDGDARNPDSRPFAVEEFMACWAQMERLVDAGLVRSIGMSNMTVTKLRGVLPLCRIAPALIEMELHPAFQQKELFDYCMAQGIQPIGYCPIGSPNRPERDKTPQDVDAMQLPSVVAAAQAHGIHPALVCIKWAAQRGQIPIPFSVRSTSYLGNLRAVTEDPLTEAEMAAIAADDRNCRLIKGQVFLWSGAKDWAALWDGEGVPTGE